MALHAAEKYGVNVIGLTLSQNQHTHANTLARGRDSVEFRLQGWEEFREPVDRIVSIGAFEHFRIERYPDFFGRCHEILPHDGRMLLHSIVLGNEQTLEPGLPLIDAEVIRFMKFIQREIFPRGQVPPREVVLDQAAAAGFRVTRIQSLRPHYARTLDCWAQRLSQAEERAVEIVPREVFDRYQRYLMQCAHYFRTGHCDVLQFSLEKAPA
jgi:cyclopropane-fatty-acyl-phospholipid synthase